MVRQRRKRYEIVNRVRIEIAPALEFEFFQGFAHPAAEAGGLGVMVT